VAVGGVGALVGEGKIIKVGEAYKGFLVFTTFVC